MTAQMPKGASLPGGSSPARWEDLPQEDQMADEIDAPLAAVKIYARKLLEEPDPVQRRKFYRLLVENLRDVETSMHKYCRVERPRHNPRFWERSWWARGSR